MFFELYMVIFLFCIALLTLFFVQISRSGDNRTQQREYKKLLLTAMCLFFIDLFWCALEVNVIRWDIPALDWAVNDIFFALSGLVGYRWLMYSEAAQKSKLYLLKRNRLICLIPTLILTVLSVCSYRNGWIFYIDEAGTYHRGKLFAIQIICAYVPAVLSSVKAYIKSFKTKNFLEHGELAALGTFPIVPIITFVLQLVFPKTPALTVGLTFGGVLIFIKMKESQIFTDPLTGLNNRYRTEIYLMNKTGENRTGKEKLFVLMMDVDNFKYINDNFGHFQGDEALKAVAEVLKSSCKYNNVFISRYGGDEFMVVCEGESISDAEAIADDITESFEKTKGTLPWQLRVSIGIGEYSESMTTQQLVEEADKNMYKAKKTRKHS